MPVSDAANLPLRDIHLPDPISWWPLAPGWWILITLVIVLILSISFAIYYLRRRKYSVSYLADTELQNILQSFANDNNKQELVKSLSVLLRRVAISQYPREETASLTGNDWLTFLDQFNLHSEFTHGVGRVLVEAPYKPSVNYDEQELIRLVALTITQLKNKKKKVRS